MKNLCNINILFGEYFKPIFYTVVAFRKFSLIFAVSALPLAPGFIKYNIFVQEAFYFAHY